MRSPFEPTRTRLAQQTYPGSRRLKVLEDRGITNPPDERAYTVRVVECPDCGASGKIKDYHGTNCFFDCRECGQALRS